MNKKILCAAASALAMSFAFAADQTGTNKTSDNLVDSKWKRLYSESAESSSFLKSNWNKYEENYHPNYILDDDPSTAWVKGSAGDGTGETVSWQVSQLKSADRVMLRIRNGYQKSEKLFQANSSVKDLEVALLGVGKKDAFRGKFTLDKKMGWQSIEIPVPNGAGFSRVELKVLSVYPGSVYKDLCISDVQTYVQSKVPYDQKGELAKQKRLMNWIHGRVNDAKYFAALPAEYPFAASQLVQKDFKEETDPGLTYNEFLKEMIGNSSPTFMEQMKNNKPSAAFLMIFSKNDLATVSNLLDQAKKIRGNTEWFRESLSKKASAVRKPDLSGENSFHLKDVLDVLSRYSLPSEITYFATDQAIGYKKTAANLDSGGVLKVISNVKLAKDQNGLIQALYFWQKTIGEERGVWEEQRDILVQYDTQRRIGNVLVWHHGLTDEQGLSLGTPEELHKALDSIPTDKEAFDMTDLQLITPTYDASGKIESVTFKSASIEPEVGSNRYFLGRWGKAPAVLSENP